jgi:thiol-disulfide isomerase/thioredoxin
MKTTILVCLSALIFAQSCMPSQSSQNGSNTTPNPATKTNTTTTTTTPGGTTSSVPAQFQDIGTSAMMVIQGDNQVSLADVARNSTGKLTVFQFVGVTCVDCKTEGPAVAQALTKYGTSVSRVMIFPNAASEYKPSEYLNFTSNYAAGAPYVVDDTLAVVKKVRANTTQYFGLFILVWKTGEARVLNETNAYMNVDSAVKAALGQ